MKNEPHPLVIQYQKLKLALEAGGELWYFSSPQETWNRLAGRAGYAVLRNGEVVAAIVTLLS
jgi:hypothetical protein